MKQPPSGGVHFFVGELLGELAFPLLRPGERLAQGLAVELDAAFLLVAELDRDLDGSALTEQGRSGKREHDAHLVVENVRAIAAQRLVHRFLAVLGPDDQPVGRIDEEFLRQFDLVAIAVDDELAVEARGDLDVGAKIARVGVLEFNLVDARAGLAVGGLPFPRTEGFRVKAVGFDGEGARDRGKHP